MADFFRCSHISLFFVLYLPKNKKWITAMRSKSHHQMGRYLASTYLSHISQINIHFFLIGCTEPDRNPLTYFKGSFRHQWLRGHNYRNARRYMHRISCRLERKETWNLWDYYTLGKLVHYTADAFTYAHNDRFPSQLRDHREYEEQLQEHFLQYLKEDPEIDLKMAASVMEAVHSYHQEYMKHSVGIQTDSHFALAACCCIVSIFFSRQMIS